MSGAAAARNPTGRAEVRAWLARHGLAPHRARGQNFLCDPALAARLVEEARVGPADTVLEIGTGLGILTRALAERARRVVSVEVDAGLVRALRAEGGLPPRVELLHADALALDLEAVLAGAAAPRRLVASLPYSVATPLLRRFLDLRELLAGWSVMVQRELAARILGHPGSRDYGSLAVLHAIAARVERGLDLPPGCFYPAPRVTSTFLHLVPRLEPWVGAAELAAVERLVRAAFAHRRKTLVNSLQQACAAVPPAALLGARLARLGVAPRSRAEDVPPDTWRALAGALAAGGAEPGRP